MQYCEGAVFKKINFVKGPFFFSIKSFVKGLLNGPKIPRDRPFTTVMLMFLRISILAILFVTKKD